MLRPDRVVYTVVVGLGPMAALMLAQDRAAPTNDLPNPYKTVEATSSCRPAGLGIDERGRHRQGRQVDLGGRALRHQLVLDGGRQDVADPTS